MIEDIPDDRRIFDAADDPHDALALRANQGIDLVDLLNQPGPVPPKDLFITLRFEDAGDGVIQTFFLAFSPRDVAVIAVIFHHLLAPVRDVRAHGGQPFQRREALVCPAVL
jgi:hypothetical protein